MQFDLRHLPEPGQPAPRIGLDSRAELQRAVAVLLALAQRKLDCAAPDLARFDLSLSAHVAGIERMLVADPQARVRLLVDDPRWFQTRAARLQRLRADFSHALSIRQAIPEDPVGDDEFMLGDDAHALVLKPLLIVSGDLWLHDTARARARAESFERRWQAAGYDLPAFTLGL